MLTVAGRGGDAAGELLADQVRSVEPRGHTAPTNEHRLDTGNVQRSAARIKAAVRIVLPEGRPRAPLRAAIDAPGTIP
jgi:hypothetical protein